MVSCVDLLLVNCGSTWDDAKALSGAKCGQVCSLEVCNMSG